MIMIEKLTESEELVMKAIWDCHKEPPMVDIMNRVNSYYGKDWKPQTISTFLMKLAQKNYVMMQRNGKRYTYKILVSEEDYRQKLYKHHIRFWNSDDIRGFVAEMFHNGDLSREDLEDVLQSIKKNRK